MDGIERPGNDFTGFLRILGADFTELGYVEILKGGRAKRCPDSDGGSVIESQLFSRISPKPEFSPLERMDVIERELNLVLEDIGCIVESVGDNASLDIGLEKNAVEM